MHDHTNATQLEQCLANPVSKDKVWHAILLILLVFKIAKHGGGLLGTIGHGVMQPGAIIITGMKSFEILKGTLQEKYMCVC